MQLPGFEFREDTRVNTSLCVKESMGILMIHMIRI